MGGTAAAPPRLWCNLGDGVRVPAIMHLVARLLNADPALSVVLTGSRGVAVPARLPDRVELRPRPVDIRHIADRFVADIRPDLALLTGADLLPAASQACHAAGVPLILIDGRRMAGSGLLGRFTDFRTRGRLRLFDRILAASETDAAQLRRVGVDAARIEVLGPIEEASPAPPCNEQERDGLARLLGTRPVWLAAGIEPAEVDAVAAAQRAAARLSHRLLLIAMPADPALGRDFAARFQDKGWQTRLRSDGEEPDPETQVYVADEAGEIGLWYRLAPISFVGSSLVPPGGGLDPYVPAALGSAIVHGPHMQDFAEQARRLAAADCAIRVETADALGAAVTTLLSPDKAANRAHGAWEVISEGAEASDRLVEHVLAALRKDAA